MTSPTPSGLGPAAPVAVVVGAGAMGMAAARRLGERHRLILADRDEPHLQRQSEALRAEGHDVVGVACDVVDPAAVARLAAATAQRGPLRVLAHVVGLSPSMADWRTIMNVNLVGAALVHDAMLPLAVADAAAIFVASMAAQIAPPADDVTALLDRPLEPGFSERLEAALREPPTPALAYQLSKFALVRMCQRNAAAWGARGARIVSLSPGLIASPMGALEFERQPMKHGLLQRTPLGREGGLLEIADALEFLASDRASFVSGIDLLVDGGLAAAMRHPA
jgi:NAD(P)-dependent dehydrogenase (short-subunit alcohol dehydrogenase family)